MITLVIVASGCASTTRTEYVRPVCDPPILQSLPEINGGQLFDLVGADRYFQLSLREKLIVDWALEMESMLLELCSEY